MRCPIPTYSALNVTPFDEVVTANKYLWVCSENHTWEASYNNVVNKGSGCPYCTGKLAIVGVNDLETTHPSVAYQLKDKSLGTSLKAGSSRKVEFVCPKGHTWVCAVSKVCSRGTTCTVCSGKTIVEGINSLADLYPKIFAEALNKNQAKSLGPGSNMKIDWECSKCSEVWSASVNHRCFRNTGCPYCSGKLPTKLNNLKTVHPELTSIWSPDNNPMEEYTPSSGKKVYWECNKGHKWEASISHVSSSGTRCPFCANKKVKTGFNDISTTNPSLLSEWDYDNNDKLPHELTRSSGYLASWVCPVCGYNWDARVYTRNISGCPSCSRSTKSSKAESRIYEDIKSYYSGPIMRNTKDLLGNLELDIYLPELNIAIEFNGLYWHSTQFRDKNYHKDKSNACTSRGIQLIHIWEDSYIENSEMVLRMIKHKLGFSDSIKIPARKTLATIISKKEAKNFLDENHIQGYTSGTYYVGLRTKDSNDLVSVMVLTKTSGKLTLDRYATSCILPGGQSKLLSYVDKNIDYDYLITFADLSVSNGDLYEKTGWVKEKLLPPDYMYVVKNKRVHKFNYRLSRFKSDPSLEYADGLSERQLADINGLTRVYDCGKIRYKRYNPRKDKVEE